MSSSKERLSDRFKRKILGRDKPNQAILKHSVSSQSSSLSLRPVTPTSASRSSSPAGGNVSHWLHTPPDRANTVHQQNHPPPASTSFSKPANVIQQSVTNPPVPPASSPSNVPVRTATALRASDALHVGTHIVLLIHMSAAKGRYSYASYTCSPCSRKQCFKDYCDFEFPKYSGWIGSQHSV